MDKYSIKVEFDWKSPARLLISGPDHNGDYAVRDHDFVPRSDPFDDRNYSPIDYVVYGTGGRDPVDSWGDEWPPDPDSFGERPSEDRDAVEDKLLREEHRNLEENHLWLDDSIQFPRLLAEIWANGIPLAQLNTICESMSITNDQLYELFDRADTEWERQKEITRLAQLGRK